MRYMRWSYPELLTCPDDYLEVIGDEAKRETQAAKSAASTRKRSR